MPNRLIRGDLLDSERYNSLSLEAKVFYFAILLTADDVGLFEAGTFMLARRANLPPARAAGLLQELIDQDLVRAYEVDGKTFGFVPRFRQRLQIKRTKLPLPPASLVADDQEVISKINELASNPPRSTVNHRTSPSELEVEVEEKKKRLTPSAAPTSPASRSKPKAPSLGVDFLVSQGVDPTVAKDWLTVRVAKRAPMTQSAWAAHLREAAVAGVSPPDAARHCAERSWIGFKAEYLANARASDPITDRRRQERDDLFGRSL